MVYLTYNKSSDKVLTVASTINDSEAIIAHYPVIDE